MEQNEQAEHVVHMSGGSIRGTAEHGIRRFLGVPYAAAPVGRNRLRPPQPVVPWQGVRDATVYGPTAPKGSYPAPVVPILPEVTIPGDEWLNCNVWTPVGADRLPVFVWIHGGSFLQGSGSLPEYDGTAFARDGIVCVTINYRLGAEGSLVTEDGSPNLGMQDQVAALRWVRDEIARFGGDPDRVTVAGESAGAASVATLLTMPSARGLFAAAVIQSGAGSQLLPVEEGRALTDALAADLGVPPTTAALAAVPPDTLVEAVAGVVARASAGGWGSIPRGGVPFAPVIDGDLVPLRPVDAVRAGIAADVPVLLGTTRDEYELFARPAGLVDATDEAGLRAAAERWGLPAEGLDVYRRRRPGATPGELLVAVGGDQRFRMPTVALAEALAARGVEQSATTAAQGSSGTWMYRFDAVDARDNDGLGSCHAADTPFVFETVTLPELAPRIGPHPSQRAARTVHDAWVTFVRTGRAPWRPYDLDQRTTALLADTITEVDDPDGDERRAWNPASLA
ncbi:carboxylesterase family protein [Curtobacterium sp. MCBD17_035]|uniref:carboxylesterase/lipase family protein n=1 Tax=Curtobacterium sp. MCBD17_035 TaxID=2175673 RepID=UPI001C654827|nr:carboxylesterase family protein [Curtobacterium sp. MCBD17_035]WIB66914.1 carboxylesterase family protein [Curtobacterium sp. MCBD17_035]